jgi:alpha-L-fucosidase
MDSPPNAAASKCRVLVPTLLIGLVVAAASAAFQISAAEGPANQEPKQRKSQRRLQDIQPLVIPDNERPAHERRMAWWREAKFGMFIHWGIYSIPAGVWKGQEVRRGAAEWIMLRARLPVKEYEQLAGQFNPAKFDADEWVTLAREAGMKYLVITAKHHDGFAMFESKASKFNIVAATPFGRDPLKELSAACRKQGLQFGVYYSHSAEWHHPGGLGNDWDYDKNRTEEQFEQFLNEKSIPQVRELMSSYGPISLIWFDAPGRITRERADRFKQIIRELQPDCIINGRLFKPDGGDYIDVGDNTAAPGVLQCDWEIPAKMNGTWGYKSYANDWRSTAQLVFTLVDVVSKGGNCLLNVGPTAEGVIPPEAVKRLREIGAWMKVNGEAIYGTKPTPFGEEFTDKLWRCTTRPGKLYIHLFGWPKDLRFRLPCPDQQILRASLLADPSHTSLPVKARGRGFEVELPATMPDPADSVLALEITR